MKLVYIDNDFICMGGNKNIQDNIGMDKSYFDDVDNPLLSNTIEDMPSLNLNKLEDANNTDKTYESLLDITPRSESGGNIVDNIVGGRARLSARSNMSNRSGRARLSARSNMSNHSIKSNKKNTKDGNKIIKTQDSDSESSSSEDSDNESSDNDSDSGSSSESSDNDSDSGSGSNSDNESSDNDSDSESGSESSDDDHSSDEDSVAGGEDNNPYMSDEEVEEEMEGGFKKRTTSTKTTEDNQDREESAKKNIADELTRDNECGIDKENRLACGIFDIPEYSKKIVEYATQEFNRSFDNPEKAYHAIRKKLKCGNSVSCVIEDIMTKHDILRIAEKYFKPLGPAKSTEWLSNHNIDNLLRQLEEAYKGKYKHIPFQMIDFDEMPNSELRNLDILKYYDEGYKGIGCVINTDVSSGSGIHWFCVYISMDQKNKHITLEYFNSSGQSPLKSINQWLHMQQKKLSDGGHVRAEIINVLDNEQIQKDSHSCGVWSITYILLRTRGMPYNTFKKIGAKDDLMIEMRKRLFIDK